MSMPKPLFRLYLHLTFLVLYKTFEIQSAGAKLQKYLRKSKDYQVNC